MAGEWREVGKSETLGSIDQSFFVENLWVLYSFPSTVLSHMNDAGTPGQDGGSKLYGFRPLIVLCKSTSLGGVSKTSTLRHISTAQVCSVALPWDRSLLAFYCAITAHNNSWHCWCYDLADSPECFTIVILLGYSQQPHTLDAMVVTIVPIFKKQNWRKELSKSQSY